VTRSYRPLLVISFTSLLGACATLPQVSPDDAEAMQRQHEEQLARFEDWQLSGKISVQDGQDNFSGQLHWRRNSDSYELLIVAPMGRGSWRLEGTGAGAVLTDEKQQVWRGNDAESLLSQRAGWHVPVDDLVYWIRAIRAPDHRADVEFDSRGRIEHLREAGWTVTYQAWQESAGMQLPRKMIATKDPYRLKLVINEWTLGPEPGAAEI
jgi:outer membrane lipoprotein LolB